MKIYHKKWRAMGTDCEIFVNSTVDPSDDIQRVITLIADYEQRFSRFLNQSELSILNYEKSLVVSPIFWEIMVISDKLFTFSNGIFNTLASSYHTGYVKSFIQAEPADFVKLEGREQNFDYQSIMKDEKTRKITLQSGQYLDFGGFLKGEVADRGVKVLKKYEGGFVNMGGDIATWGVSEKQADFSFSIAGANLNKKIIGILKLKNKGIATSGTFKRRWQIAGQDYHHITDTKIKNSSRSDVIMATVVAETAVLADVIATSVVIMGIDEALDFVVKKGASALLIDQDSIPYLTENMSQYFFNV